MNEIETETHTNILQMNKFHFASISHTYQTTNHIKLISKNHLASSAPRYPQQRKKNSFLAI